MRARRPGIALLLLTGVVLAATPPVTANELLVTSEAALGPLPPFPAVQCTGDLAPGPCGLEIVLEGDNETTYLVTGTPNQEDGVRVSFLLDPNDVPLPPLESIRLFKMLRKASPKEHLVVWLQRNRVDTGYALDIWQRGSFNTASRRVATPWLPVNAGPYTVDLEWIQGNGNGILRVFINGALRFERTNLFTSIYDVDEVRLGVFRPADRTSTLPTGSVYVDNFRVDRIAR